MTKKCTQTKSLALPKLSLLYSSKGEIMSRNLTKLGTLPVGTILSSMIAGNLPNAKRNLLNVWIISFILGSFFKSIKK